MHANKFIGALLVVGLTGCASVPVGPSIAVMPAPGKPFDTFRHEDAMCKSFAREQLGSNPDDVAQKQVISGAAVGAVIGATAGSIVGDGRGGAAAGLILGAGSGSNAAAYSNMTLQRRYDIAYSQCMYTKGNQVPGYPSPMYTPPPRRRS